MLSLLHLFIRSSLRPTLIYKGPAYNVYCESIVHEHTYQLCIEHIRLYSLARNHLRYSVNPVAVGFYLPVILLLILFKI